MNCSQVTPSRIRAPAALKDRLLADSWFMLLIASEEREISMPPVPDDAAVRMIGRLLALVLLNFVSVPPPKSTPPDSVRRAPLAQISDVAWDPPVWMAMRLLTVCATVLKARVAPLMPMVPVPSPPFA